METNIRINALELSNEMLRIGVSKDDGTTETLILPITDFILLRLRLNDISTSDQTRLADQARGQAIRSIQSINPHQLTVTKDALSSDPLLIFGVAGLGDLPIRIPRPHLAAVMQQLLPFLAQETDPAAGATKN